jgi:hypothetical protein
MQSETNGYTVAGTRASTGGMTRAEVAEVLGVSPKRVEQIELRALAKCRKKFAAMGIKFRDCLPETTDTGDRW